ncbi:MAG: class I SAM-dependent methyltransferase [Ginsengibacter sp.]
MTENFNNNYSRYYDLLYKDKDYKAEADYVIQLIRTLYTNAKDILELGSGTGNHAHLLCKEDFKVTGLERSADMVSLAKEKAIDGFTQLVADITNFELHQKFDVAISLFHVLSYLNTNDSLIACFNTVNKHLKPKGIFIFDVWYSPAVYFQKPETRVKKMEDDVFNITRLAQPEMHDHKNVVDVNYEISIQNKATQVTEIYKEKHPMRHFSIPEIELLATHTNFNLIKAEEFLSAKQPGNDTWGICFVLQKKA